MIFYIKNQLKYYGIVLILQIVLIAGMYQYKNCTLFESCEILYGNQPFIWITDKIGFFIFMLLLQMMNGNMLLYYLRNKSYFSVRMVSQKKQIGIFMRKVGVNIVAFWLISFIAVCMVATICSIELTLPSDIEILISIIKSSGKLILFSCAQVIFLLLLSEDTAFLCFIVCVLIFAFCNNSYFYLSDINEWTKIVILLSLYCGITFVEINLIKKIYLSKEGV